MLTKSCPICGKNYIVRPYRFLVSKFCSQKCYGLSERGRIPKSAFKKGHRSSPETEFHSGKLHRYFGKRGPAYGKKWGLSGQGARTVRLRFMNTLEYREWRTAVFARDDFTCQECFKRGVVLHAHHIKPYRLYPELVLVLDNGQTLCKPCHIKTGTFGRPKSSKVVSQSDY